MDFSSAHLQRPAILAAALFAVFFFATGPGASLQAGQAIWFSTPRSNNISSTVPALSPKSPGSLDFDLPAQSTLKLNSPPSDAPPPPNPLTISPAEQAQREKQSDRRNNWMLLTPAEILGVTTPEKILGVQERDALGQLKNLTVLERYTERQNQMRLANSNAVPNEDSPPAWDLSKYRREQSDAFNSINGGLDNPASGADQLFNSRPDNQLLAGQSQNSDPSKLFGSPPPLPTPSTAQQLNMERFRQLLGTSPAPDSTALPPPSDKLFSQSGKSPDVTSGQPSQNPIGTLFPQLNSGIGKPADLPTLPGAWGLSYTSSRPSAAWAPQPPPWLSADPQPFAAPQRKF